MDKTHVCPVCKRTVKGGAWIDDNGTYHERCHQVYVQWGYKAGNSISRPNVNVGDKVRLTVPQGNPGAGTLFRAPVGSMCTITGTDKNGVTLRYVGSISPDGYEWTDQYHNVRWGDFDVIRLEENT